MTEETTTQPRCPSCDAPVHEDWRFCQECGAERPGLYGEDADPALDPLRAATGQLEPAEAARGVPWRAIEAVPVYLLTLASVIAVLPIVGLLLGDPDAPGVQDTALAIGLVGFQLATVGITVAWVRIRHGAAIATLGMRRPTGRMLGYGVVAGLLGLAVATGIAWIQALLIQASTGSEPPAPDQLPLEDPASVGLVVLLGIATILLAPISEELFFRGMLFQGLRMRRTLRASVLITSFWFAIAHLDLEMVFGGDPLQTLIVIPPIFGLALVLANAMERFGNVWVPIVAHATFNVFGFFVQVPELLRG